MEDEYAFDTNVLSALATPSAKFHQIVTGHVKAIGKAVVYLPAMVIAEIEFGLAKLDSPDPKQTADIRRFFRIFKSHLPFNDGAIEQYALIRAELFRSHGTPKGSHGGHKEILVEDLKDKSTCKDLGIDERDLIIVSIAASNGLVLATIDRNAEMKRIEEAAKQAVARGKPVTFRFEDWTLPVS